MDHLERFASELAEWCNGGMWNKDYTNTQKELWRGRAKVIKKRPDELDYLLGYADTP